MIILTNDQRAHDIAMTFVNSYLNHLNEEAFTDEFVFYTSEELDEKPHVIDVYNKIYEQALKSLH